MKGLAIKKVTIIGSGVMGSQIAALLADAGVTVHLLDLPGPESTHDSPPHLRNAPALKALAQLKKLKPSPLCLQSSLQRIIPGNLEDDLAVISDCQWVVEVVVERLDIKKKIHQDIARHISPQAFVSTNTSGILLKDMAVDFSEPHAQRFLGTHFFNPPRYMKLVEIIPGHHTDPTLITEVSAWIEKYLGKTMVSAEDTVNFIANRIGVFSLLSVAHEATRLDINPETVDALTGKLLGRPSSATYRTMDVVGLDTAAMVAANVYDNVPADPYHSSFKVPAWIQTLIAQKHLGQKTRFTGIFKKTKDATGKTQILCYRHADNSYAPQDLAPIPWLAQAMAEKDIGRRLTYIFEQDDAASGLIWKNLSEIFSYSALLLQQIAGSSPYKIDQAMKWGFNWEYGVFELWQLLGFQAILKKMLADKITLPEWITAQQDNKTFAFFDPSPLSESWALYQDRKEWHPTHQNYVAIERPAFFIPLPPHAVKADQRRILGDSSSSLLDLNDHILALNFHTKMNTINAAVVDMIVEAVIRADSSYKGLVIANQGKAFSAGADLKMILSLIEANDFDGIDSMLRSFQGALQRLKYAAFPVVSAPHGLVLGGGCEVTLHTAYRHVAYETYAGLVEAGVGLLPAAGGCKELALRCYRLAAQYQSDPMIYIRQAFENIAMAKTSSSGFETVAMGFYPRDNTTFTASLNHQVYQAKLCALHAYDQGYRPALPATNVAVAGNTGFETLRMMLYNMREGKMISEHDFYVAEKIAFVLCGGDLPANTPVDESWFLDLERAAFIALCRHQKTQERIRFMLKKGKPLRN